MADLEIDEDFREKFAYLFKPVTDFAKNFEIDLIELLQDYDNQTMSVDTGFNFVNASAMLQGTTSVYGRRVDMLHKAVTTFKTEFSKEPEKKKKGHKDDQQEGNEDGEADEEIEDENDDDKQVHAVDKTKKSRLNGSMQEDASFHASRSRMQPVPLIDRPTGIKVNKPDRLGHKLAKATLHDNGMVERDIDDGLCIYERFHVDKGHNAIHICPEREYQLMFLMPGSMMPLLSSEKRPVELLGNYGKFGDVDDYRMCRDLVVHNHALYCNPGGTFCYLPSKKVDPCEAIHTKIKQVLQAAQNQNLLPSSCAGEVEATLQNNFKSGRTSFDLVEICRRVSDGQATTDFIHRISHYVSMNDPYRRQTELRSQMLPASQEPPIALDDYGADNDFSFAGVDFDSVVNPGGEGIVRDSLDPPATGVVTRSRQAQNSSNEPRKSVRLSEQNDPIQNAELMNDEFELLNLYDETVFKYKPFVEKRTKSSAQNAVRRRDNQMKREFEKDGKVYLPSLQRYLDNCFWTRRGKKKLKQSVYELSLAHQLRKEEIRRKTIKAELRKVHMAGIRQKKPLKNNILILPEVGKRAKKSMEILQQKVDESFQEPPIDNDNEDYDFDNDYDDFVPATPVPLGDFMPDHPVDMEDLSRLSLGRRNTSQQHFPQNNISFDAQDFIVPDPSPTDEFILPPNASISAIVQIFMSRKWNDAVKRKPGCQERLVNWERKMTPILAELKDDFLAQDYGKIILNKFGGEIGRRIFFSEIIEGRQQDKSRFFLALLMLTNRGTVIIYPAALDLNKENSSFARIDSNAPDDFEIELLNDTDWQGDEMNQTGLFD